MDRETGRDTALALVFAALWACHLGSAELVSNDESRSGVIVRDILEGGHWLLPRTPDGHVSEKPPLYYWMCAALGRVAGVDEWTLRSVSIVMAAGTLALVWMLAGVLGAGRARVVAVFALASNLIFLTWARRAMVDMTLTFFVTAGLACYLAARRGALKIWPASVLGGLSVGMAVLSKGPLGLALPAVVVAGGWLVETRGRFWRGNVRWLAVLGALAIALLIALAWYVPAGMRGGRAFFETAIFEENVNMPLGRPQGLGVGHGRPVYHYPLAQLGALVSMLALLPETVRWTLRRDAGPARVPLLAWLGFGLLLFMAAANKRTHYLLPLQPACAVMVALATARRLDEGEASPLLRVGALVSGTVVLLLTAALIAVAVYPEWLPAVRLQRTVVLFAPAGLGLGVALLAIWQGPTRLIVRAAAGLALFVVAARTTLFADPESERGGMQPFVAAMRRALPPDTRPVVLPPIHGYALDFYWPERLPRDEGAVQTASWFFVRADRLAELQGAFEVVGESSAKWEDRRVALVRRR